jgi:hypothetical protein
MLKFEWILVLRFFKTFHLKFNWHGQLNFSSAVFFSDFTRTILAKTGWTGVEDRLNRSLTGQRRSVRAGLSAAAFFSHAIFLAAQQAMQNLFLGRPVTAALKCQGAQIFGLTGRIHSAAGRADFFYGLSGHSRAAVSARAATFSFAVRSPPRRNVRARRNLFRLSGHILAARQFFFAVRSHPRSSVLAQIFFGRAVFSFAVRSHLRRTFWLFVAHGISAVHRFRIPHSTFLAFTVWRICFLLRSRVRNLNFFSVFPLPFLALWPHWSEAVEPAHGGGWAGPEDQLNCLYIYLSLPFSSLTPPILALVSSQHLEPHLSLTSNGSQFQNLSNHGASSQPFRDWV